MAFGIAKDIFGSKEIMMKLDEATVQSLRAELEKQYPALKDLASYMIAVNDEYADSNTVLHTTDEVAIIPPVSGG